MVDDVEESRAAVQRLAHLAGAHPHLIGIFTRVIQHWLPLDAALVNPEEPLVRRMQSACFSGLLELSMVEAIPTQSIPSLVSSALGCIYGLHSQFLESAFEMTVHREHLLDLTSRALVVFPWLRSQILADELAHRTFYRAWIKAASDEVFHTSLVADRTDPPFVSLSQVAESLHNDISRSDDCQEVLIARWDDAIESTSKDVLLSCTTLLVREFQLCRPQVYRSLFFAYQAAVARGAAKFVLLSQRTLHWACQLLPKLVRLASRGPLASDHPFWLDASIMHLTSYLSVTASFGPRCIMEILNVKVMLSAMLRLSSASVIFPNIKNAGEKKAIARLFRCIGAHLLHPRVLKLFRCWRSRVIACSGDESLNPLVLSAVNDLLQSLDSIEKARAVIDVGSFRLCRLPSVRGLLRIYTFLPFC